MDLMQPIPVHPSAGRIRARLTVPGVHYWPDAKGTRAYLAFPHRHLFHVAVEVPVTHEERQIEFHDLRQLAWEGIGTLGGPWASDPSLIDFGPASCETLARRLGEWLTHRGVPVGEVVWGEDGESEAVVAF